MLDTEEVVAGGEGLGDGDVDLGQALRRPAELAVVERGALAVNLEPDVTLTLEVGGSGSVGSLGHVELEGTRVGDVGVDGETEVVAGLDGQSLGRGVGGVLVAADVLRGNIGDGAMRVVVGSHADVLPVLGDLALVNKGREGVVSTAQARGSEGSEGGRELHVDFGGLKERMEDGLQMVMIESELVSSTEEPRRVRTRATFKVERSPKRDIFGIIEAYPFPAVISLFGRFCFTVRRSGG